MKLSYFLLSLCFLSTNAFCKPSTKIQQSLDASLIVMVPGVGSGSGTAVYWDEARGKTIVVTNNHVCQMTRKGIKVKTLNATSLFVTDMYNNKHQGKVVFTNESGADLCLIEVDEKMPTIVLAPTSVEIGTKVYSVGAPRGWFPFIYEGYASFSSIDDSKKPFQIFAISGTFGSSGSGVYDLETGKLVAVIFAMTTYGDEKSGIPFFMVGVPVNFLRVLMEKYSDINNLNWRI